MFLGSSLRFPTLKFQTLSMSVNVLVPPLTGGPGILFLLGSQEGLTKYILWLKVESYTGGESVGPEVLYTLILSAVTLVAKETVTFAAFLLPKS